VAAPDTAVRTDPVASPGNLTDLGVTLTRRLESHGASDPRTILCLRSLTVLLQYSAPDEVYRFLHTLLAQLDRFDATGHFHLHREAHDRETIDALRPLFDRVRRDGDDA
jgi:hypothetical protein